MVDERMTDDNRVTVMPQDLNAMMEPFSKKLKTLFTANWPYAIWIIAAAEVAEVIVMVVL